MRRGCRGEEFFAAEELDHTYQPIRMCDEGCTIPKDGFGSEKNGYAEDRCLRDADVVGVLRELFTQQVEREGFVAKGVLLGAEGGVRSFQKFQRVVKYVSGNSFVSRGCVANGMEEGGRVLLDGGGTAEACLDEWERLDWAAEDDVNWGGH